MGCISTPRIKISWIILILCFHLRSDHLSAVWLPAGPSASCRRFGANMTMLPVSRTIFAAPRPALPGPHHPQPRPPSITAISAGYPAYDNTDVTFYGDTCEALAPRNSPAQRGKADFMEYHAIEDASAWQELEDILAERSAPTAWRCAYFTTWAASGLSTANLSKAGGRGISAAGSTRSSQF